ncbi:MAG: SGNH/GDSL hydrolase family protein [Lachnospiraceae bacterium]|nr:SGNH/GDSL hydrolase family protein [Lachnospiraceae bacterium]
MKTILCYGDSNTYGFDPVTGLRYPKTVRWTGRLQSLLGDAYLVVEEGCNGRTTVFEDPVEGWKRGLDYLRPCLNTHKPVDVVILMLGTNDLKELFGASAQMVAQGAETLVETIQTFTAEKQGYVPEVILVSPPLIGEGVCDSAFCHSFGMRAVMESRKLAQYYCEVAKRKNCFFFDAAKHIEPSEEDCVHLSPEAHEVMAEKMASVVMNMNK